jgi:HlyD family secretion protein
MLKKAFVFIGRNKVIIFSSLFLLLAGVFLGNKIFAPKKSKYQAVKVVKKDLSSVVSASGEIKSEEEATLKFQTSGQLAWIGVKKGEKVKKWQSVACLDKKELEKKLQQELLDYMNERWDYEQTTLDDYKDLAVTETIRRVKEKAGFDLGRVVLDVEIADIALKYACLVSPIDGIVTEITTPHPGTNVYLVNDKIVISNPDKVVFKANVDEVDIGKIKKGMPAKIILDAYPEEEINSLVEEVEFTSTMTSGGGTAFSVKFNLPPNTDEEKFKLGMNGDVEILTEKRQNVFVVPFEAIQENDEVGEFVWLIKDGKPQKQAVKTGIGNDLETQILEGLKEGDKVIVSGFKTLEKKS